MMIIWYPRTVIVEACALKNVSLYLWAKIYLWATSTFASLFLFFGLPTWDGHYNCPSSRALVRSLSLPQDQGTTSKQHPQPHYSLANSLSLSWAPPAVNSCSLPCVYPFLSGRTTTSESELKFRPRWIFLNRSSSFWQPFCLFNKSRSDPCFVRIGLVGGSVDWMDGLLLFFYAIQLMAFPLSPAFSWLSAAVIPLMELHLLS